MRFKRLRVERSEFLRKFRLLVVGVVLVKNAFRASGVDCRNGFGIERSRGFLIAGVHCGKEFFDARFQSGFDRLVLLRLFFGYEHALFSGFNVGHGSSPFSLNNL